MMPNTCPMPAFDGRRRFWEEVVGALLFAGALLFWSLFERMGRLSRHTCAAGWVLCAFSSSFSSSICTTFTFHLQHQVVCICLHPPPYCTTRKGGPRS